jgi:hypothetical protein
LGQLSSDYFIILPQKSCTNLEQHFLKKEMQRQRSAFGSLADSWVIFANHFQNEIENLRGRDFWNTTNEQVKRATEGELGSDPPR